MSTEQEIISIYKATGSIKATSKISEVRGQVIRRVLITNGLYTSPMIDKIAELQESGYSLAEIAEYLHKTKSWIICNTPYTKGSYVLTPKSKNAVKIQKSREKKKKEIIL